MVVPFHRFTCKGLHQETLAITPFCQYCVTTMKSHPPGLLVIIMRSTNPVPYRQRVRGSEEKAFSLVETVLALGIVSFACTVILGLLPVGLNSFRSSIEETMQAQILNSLTTQTIQSDFVNLNRMVNSYYYDDEGQPVSEASQAVYTAKVTFSPAAQVIASSNLAVIQVDIYTTRGSAIQSNERAKATYTIRVANRG